MHENIVFFDANYLYQKKFTSYFKNEEDLRKFSSRAEIIIPKIVLEEINKNHRKEYEKIKENKMANALFGPQLKEDSVFLDKLSEMKEKTIGMIKFEEIDLENPSRLYDIKKMALENKPPFHHENDRGFKDAYIYHCVLEYIKKNKNKKFFFCTNDERFRSAFESHQNITLIRNYKEFIEHSIFKYEKKVNKEKIKEYFQRNLQVEKIEMIDLEKNIEKDDIVKIKADEKIYRIIVSKNDIKSAIGEKYLDDCIENLRKSPSFSDTHAAIKKLKPITAFLYFNEIEDILTSASENEQVRWIINDGDVKEFVLSIYKPVENVLDPSLKQKLELDSEKNI